MADFGLETSQVDGGIMVIDVRGFLDAHTFERLDQAIEQCFAQDAHRLIVKLDQVEYISSAGLGVVIMIGKRLSSAGGKLRLCNLNETVFEVFEISGFSTIFSVFKDQAEALDSF